MARKGRRGKDGEERMARKRRRGKDGEERMARKGMTSLYKDIG